jgi:hypothetical protein
MTSDCTLTIRGILGEAPINLTYKNIQHISLSNTRDVQPRFDIEGNLISYDVGPMTEFTITGFYLNDKLTEIDKE